MSDDFTELYDDNSILYELLEYYVRKQDPELSVIVYRIFVH